MPGGIFGRLLRGTDWAEISSFLSPSFFEVVPPLAAATRLRSLVSAFVSKKGFTEACTQAEALFEKIRIPVSLAPVPAPSEPQEWSREDRGQALLEAYFAQILGLDQALLDLRFQKFTPGKSRLVWQPSPLLVTWQPAFCRDIRNLYVGFYDNDPKLFRQALTALGLSASEDLLRAHFGTDQSSVSFSLAEFRQTFHQVFVATRTAGEKIHADFLPFGAGLACLYEHLEQLGGKFDPRAAYFRVQKALGSRELS